MTIQLNSVEQAPASVPPWQQLMEDLCHPPAARVAKVLGVSVRTVHRYNTTGRAPRSVLLALFWLSSWGRNAVHTQAHNDAVLMAAYARSLRDQVCTLESRINHLVQIGDFGAANEAADASGPARPRNLPMLR